MESRDDDARSDSSARTDDGLGPPTDCDSDWFDDGESDDDDAMGSDSHSDEKPPCAEEQTPPCAEEQTPRLKLGGNKNTGKELGTISGTPLSQTIFGEEANLTSLRIPSDSMSDLYMIRYDNKNSLAQRQARVQAQNSAFRNLRAAAASLQLFDPDKETFGWWHVPSRMIKPCTASESLTPALGEPCFRKH
jgi:hypothetical protein